MRLAILASLFAASASAHTIFTDLITKGGVPGVDFPRYDALRLPTFNGPQEDVTVAAMACNGGVNPLSIISDKKRVVAAGEEVTIVWRYQLSSYEGDGSNYYVIDPSHNGPVMAYMAKVDDAVTSSAPKDGWFKIYEDGLVNGQWGVQRLIANSGKVTVKIPECVKPGDYLLRGELIALHGAGNYPGAQLYMECAQITVTGGGSASPATVSFPGAYAGTDPGIKYNLYNGQTTYTIPGPRPFTCSGTTPNPTTSPASSPATSPTTSTVRSPTTSPVTSPATSPATSPVTSPATSPVTSPSTGCTSPVAAYGQCGGLYYSGSTCCAAGYTCKFSNNWYSQCLA